MEKTDILTAFRQSYSEAMAAIKAHLKATNKPIVLFTEEEFEIKENPEHPRYDEVNDIYWELPRFFYEGKHGYIVNCYLIEVLTDHSVRGYDTDGNEKVIDIGYVDAHGLMNIYQEI